MAKKKTKKKVTKKAVKVVASKGKEIVHTETNTVVTVEEAAVDVGVNLVDEAPKKKKSKSEDLPKNLKVLNKKNGFFIETIGQGWVKLSKGQLLKLAELISE